MSLESLISNIEDKISKTNYTAAVHLGQQLPSNAKLRFSEARRLDKLAAYLSSKYTTARKRDYLLEKVNRLRSEYRDTSTDTAMQLLQARNKTYKQRFQDIQAYINRGEYSVTELDRCLDYLSRNCYLKRKSRNNKKFAKEMQEMKQKLEAAANKKALSKHLPPARYKVQKLYKPLAGFAVKVAYAVSGFLLTAPYLI